MEYTKDIILKVQYDEVNRKSSFLKRTSLSKCIEKIAKHKIITFSLLFAFCLIIVDGMLITNFIKILGNY